MLVTNITITALTAIPHANLGLNLGLNLVTEHPEISPEALTKPPSTSHIPLITTKTKP